MAGMGRLTGCLALALAVAADAQLRGSYDSCSTKAEST